MLHVRNHDVICIIWNHIVITVAINMQGDLHGIAIAMLLPSCRETPSRVGGMAGTPSWHVCVVQAEWRHPRCRPDPGQAQRGESSRGSRSPSRPSYFVKITCTHFCLCQDLPKKGILVPIPESPGCTQEMRHCIIACAADAHAKSVHSKPDPVGRLLCEFSL